MVETFLRIIRQRPDTLFESVCVILPIFIGIFRWSKLSESFKIVWYYFVLVFIMDIPLWLTAGRGINNFRWINLQEIICSGWLIYTAYTMVHIFSKKALYFFYLIFFIIILFDFNLTVHSAKIYVYVKLVSIVISFAFFHELLEKMEVKKLFLHPKFWFFTALLLTSLGTFLRFVFSSYVDYYNDKEAFHFFVIMEELFKYIFVILVSIAIWLENRYENNAA